MFAQGVWGGVDCTLCACCDCSALIVEYSSLPVDLCLFLVIDPDNLAIVLLSSFGNPSVPKANSEAVPRHLWTEVSIFIFTVLLVLERQLGTFRPNESLIPACQRLRN